METEPTTGVRAAYEALMAYVGRSGPVSRGRVYGRDFRRFALAAGAKDNREYFLESGATAPLLYVPAVQSWSHGPGADELRADGTGADRTSFLPLDGYRLMGGGQELEFHAPVVDGTELEMRSILEDVQLKQGRSGDLLVLTLTTFYTDPDGRPLVTCRDTTLVR